VVICRHDIASSHVVAFVVVSLKSQLPIVTLSPPLSALGSSHSSFVTSHDMGSGDSIASSLRIVAAVTDIIVKAE
jgi:hypothetical protein